jgi:hypothetical protein
MLGDRRTFFIWITDETIDHRRAESDDRQETDCTKTQCNSDLDLDR